LLARATRFCFGWGGKKSLSSAKEVDTGFPMKVYSPPEVLEAHIAPASLIMDGTMIQNAVNIGIDTDRDPINFDAMDFSPSQSQPEPLLIGGPEFNIRTVDLAADGSLIDGGRFLTLQDVLFQALLENSTISSTLTESTISLLAEELSISVDVMDAIESAVGDAQSADLVGLTSDEFARYSGSAFLTSL
jgi:hypothetical protein